MNLRRIGSLLIKEIVHGPKQFMFVFAVVAPILISLVVTLLFGSALSGKARLGLVDEGDSQIVPLAQALNGVTVSLYSSGAALRSAVALGAIDMGFVIPAAFDAEVKAGQTINMTVYAWGESHVKNRIVLFTALIHMMRQVAGQEPPVVVTTTTLGSASQPWEQRLLPFIVLISVLIGGVFIPATSLVNEKMKRTLLALGVTPARLGEVYFAKGTMGVAISTVMALIILTINQAFGSQPVLLVTVLLAGSVMSSTLGILLGVMVNDLNSLFATIKGLGIILYAPALVYMFPEVPQWIGRIFPTYYIVQPVIEIVQEGAGWGDVLPELGATLGFILVLMAAIGVVSQRQAQRAVA